MASPWSESMDMTGDDMGPDTGPDTGPDMEDLAQFRGGNWLRQFRFRDRVGRGAPLVDDDGLEIFQFVTLYTHAQQPFLASSQAKQLLQAKLQETKDQFGLKIAAYVMLDDHLHLLYATHFSQGVGCIVDSIRDGFAREWRRLQRREAKSLLGLDQPLWKADFQSYPLNLQEELRAHLNFIHYDPVRHGLVVRAADYTWSSLPARVRQGHYSEDWAVQTPPAGVAKVARALYLASAQERHASHETRRVCRG